MDGYSDSDFAKDPIKRRSVSGYGVFLERCPINTKSRMQRSTTLSVTEAELYAGTECGQDLMFAMWILESMGLKVKKPMVLNIDNQGCIDLINSWSAGGRTRHMDTKMYYLRELKEQEPPLIVPKYIPGPLNVSDPFTKNVDGATFQKLIPAYCGVDEYSAMQSQASEEDVA